jgi:hypothetical protein
MRFLSFVAALLMPVLAFAQPLPPPPASITHLPQTVTAPWTFNVGTIVPSARYDATAFGSCIWDGAHDVSPCVRAAVVAAVAAGNAEVDLPSGVVPFASNVVPTGGFTLKGRGPGTIWKVLTGNTSNPLLMSISGVNNITISDMTIDGGGVDFVSGNAVIQAGNASNIVFDHVYIQNSHGIALAFSPNVSNSGFRNGSVTNVGNHWITTGSNADQQQGIIFCCGTQANNFGNFVTDSSFSLTGLDAISVANQTNFTGSRNRFTNVGGRYTNGGAAIYAAVNGSLVMSDNVVNGTYGNGLDVIQTSLAVVSHNDVQFAGAAGISYAQGSWSSIIGNVSCNNNKNGGISTLQAGIALVGTTIPVTETTVAGNTACDNQGTPTQTYGIQEVAGGTYTNVWIDQSNTPDGNVSGPFGGALSGYTPLKIVTTVGGIQQTGSAPNQGVALLPTGTGYFSLSVPDSTITGGNVPGNNAVSLSIVRASAGHVALGESSFLGGGADNSVVGFLASTVGGQWNLSSGQGGYALGQFSNTEFRYGTIAFAAGEFSGQGDAQSVDGILRGHTTSATPVVLTADGTGTPNTTSIMNVGITSISIKHALGGTIIVIARSASDIKKWNCDYLMNSGSGAATVALVGSATCTAGQASAGASSWTVALTADTTNGGLTMTATGAAATTINWVARVVDVENGAL